MSWQATPYTPSLIISLLITSVLAWISWQRRRAPAAKSFTLTILSIIVWLIGYTIRWAGADLGTQLLGLRIVYIGLALSSATFLIFTLDYTGRSSWINWRTLGLLTIVPCITIVLTWTNDWHGWFWQRLWQETYDGVIVLQWQRGVWSSINAVYSFVPGLIATILLGQAFFRAPRLYRGQIAAVFLSAVLFWFNGLISAINTNVFRDYFLILFPLGIGLGSVGMFFGIFGFRMFDIMPVARATIVENMQAGMIVLDAQARVVDLNPAAQTILGSHTSQAIGKPASQVFARWHELHEFYRGTEQTQNEIGHNDGNMRRYYEVRRSPLTNEHAEILGHLIVLNDVTERRRAQQQLLEQQRTLAMVEEREHLARELHDDLAQVLGFVSAQTHAIGELLARGDIAAGQEHVARLNQVACNAHVDVREYIASAKSAVSLDQGLVVALTKYLQRYQQNYQIQTHLDVAPSLQGRVFEPIVEVQLLRIIQEALNNLRKHAQATRADVKFDCDVNHVVVTIADDGRGFAVQVVQDEAEHFGTRIMRERAQEIGGTLDIISTPGQGTQVVATIPLTRTETGERK